MSPAKLTPAQKAEVRRLYASTLDQPAVVRTVKPNPDRHTYQSLAERFGVSRETIRRALAEETEVATDE